jgi:hypothetical protein
MTGHAFYRLAQKFRRAIDAAPRHNQKLVMSLPSANVAINRRWQGLSLCCV